VYTDTLGRALSINGKLLPQPIRHGSHAGAVAHYRRGEKPCEPCRVAGNAYRNQRDRRWRLPEGDCQSCTKTGTGVRHHGGWTLCATCYSRWQKHGFTGNGPGPGFCSALDHAREHAETIATMSTLNAAFEAGVTTRTILRWKRLLAADDQGDDER
jgi:hypothetical protein